MSRRKQRRERYRSMSRLPTELDISPHMGGYESLDAAWARVSFFGKALAEAESLFRENALFYIEALHWMGPVGFEFYVRACISYIESDSAVGDSDAINGFASLLDEWARNDSGITETVASILASACWYIIDQYKKFDVDLDIYGDLKSRYVDLLQRFSISLK